LSFIRSHFLFTGIMAEQNTTHNYAIIVAGGSGTRMQITIPKQFLLLTGRPVLMHTISMFHNSASQPQIILVLHADYHAYWQQLCNEHNFNIPHQLIKGGESRFHSVKNGLDVIEDIDAVIAVHDAVRPLTPAAIIDHSYNYAAKNGNAITAVKSRDSIRQLKGDHSVSLLRDDIYLIQTPQTFQASQLKKAYEQAYDPKFTDDASVVESIGIDINLADGSYENIKITFPEDIAIAEAILNKKPSA
jgi:2-C-methyl-D-erythritol 4-phosphate cytidylyltransferase